MLILTRRVGEIIRITDDISISIEHAKPSAVKIGVDAPESVSIGKGKSKQGHQQAQTKETST